jgi:hypothetical protein
MSQNILTTSERVNVLVNTPSDLCCHDVLILVKKGESISTMAKLCKVSKQAISARLLRYKAKGLVEQLHSRPVAVYKLTSLGEVVNINNVQSVNSSHSKQKMKLWRCHALIVGHDIISWGTWKFNDTLMKRMRGWSFQELLIKGNKIHIQDTGLMKIYMPDQYTNYPAQAWANMYEQANKIANYLAQRYNMQIKPMRIIREGHKELQGTEKIAKLLGVQNIGKVRIDISEKDKPNMEEDQSEYSLEALLEMPKVLEQFQESLKLYNEQIRLHLSVMQEIRTGITELRDAVRDVKK